MKLSQRAVQNLNPVDSKAWSKNLHLGIREVNLKKSHDTINILHFTPFKWQTHPQHTTLRGPPLPFFQH